MGDTTTRCLVPYRDTEAIGQVIPADLSDNETISLQMRVQRVGLFRALETGEDEIGARRVRRNSMFRQGFRQPGPHPRVLTTTFIDIAVTHERFCTRTQKIA